MNNVTLETRFNGRRILSPERKRTFIIIGIIYLAIGIFGFISAICDENINSYFSLAASFVGFANIIYARVGKELIKEKNFIVFKSHEINYKNSFKKPRTILLSDLLDIRLETLKVEFVLKNQQVKAYNYSIFEPKIQEDIYGALQRIRTDLMNKQEY